MTTIENREPGGPFAPQALGAAVLFGAVALLVVLAGLTIPIAGTSVVTDPREIFTTLGSALSGPVGGVLVGVLAGIREPDGMAGPSLLAHVLGCVWVGWAYKHLVYRRLAMPALLLGWVALVLSYYFVLVVPGFVVGTHALRPDAFAASFGEGASLASAYATLGRGALPEALVTSLFTALLLLALPRRYRRPLW